MKLYSNRRLLMGNIMQFLYSALSKRTDESPSNKDSGVHRMQGFTL